MSSWFSFFRGAFLCSILWLGGISLGHAQAASNTPPPPLPRLCPIGSTAIRSEVCCISGYVYVYGQPFAGATVTITANGQSHSVQTSQQDERPLPYYYMYLAVDEWVQPGDLVTVTAQLGEYSKSTPFFAREQGQQVDIAIPSSAIAGSWRLRSDSISGRSGQAMAYDAGRQALVLFGGLSESTGPLLNDTWEWQSAQTGWQERPSGARGTG